MNTLPDEVKVKILAECTGHYEDLLIGALLNEDAITPKEALSAMDKWAKKIRQQEQQPLLEALESVCENLILGNSEEAYKKAKQGLMNSKK